MDNSRSMPQSVQNKMADLRASEKRMQRILARWRSAKEPACGTTKWTTIQTNMGTVKTGYIQKVPKQPKRVHRHKSKVEKVIIRSL